MTKLWNDLKKNMKDWSSAAVEKAEEVSKIAVAKTEELTKVSKIKIEEQFTEKADIKSLGFKVNKLLYHSLLIVLSYERKAKPLSSIPLLPAQPLSCKNSDCVRGLVLSPAYL